MRDEVLVHRQDVWRRKPILRSLYGHWYREIASHLKPGPTLEVGGGSGNLKEFAPHVICSDLIPAPWLDAVADARRLPFASGSLTNIVLFDALHHIEQVRLLFDEAVRVLRAGGRIVVMDPYISWLSWPIYHFFHPEPVDLRQDPLSVETPREGRKPFDANQAVATIVFELAFESFQRRYPTLHRLVHRRQAFLAYPLSGGFDHPSLLPMFLLEPLL